MQQAIGGKIQLISEDESPSVPDRPNSDSAISEQDVVLLRVVGSPKGRGRVDYIVGFRHR